MRTLTRTPLIEDLACAAIIQRGGRVLVSQRKEDQTFPLRWELPGGHIEPNESRESCIKREIKEELGVQITALREFSTQKARIGNRSIIIHYYLCRLADGKPRNLEVREFRWIKPSQHELYDFARPDRYVLQKLSKMRS